MITSNNTIFLKRRCSLIRRIKLMINNPSSWWQLQHLRTTSNKGWQQTLVLVKKTKPLSRQTHLQLRNFAKKMTRRLGQMRRMVGRKKSKRQRVKELTMVKKDREERLIMKISNHRQTIMVRTQQLDRQLSKGHPNLSILGATKRTLMLSLRLFMIDRTDAFRIVELRLQRALLRWS